MIIPGMKELLIIHPGQFGYHTSTYFYCYYLKDKYSVSYIGIDEGFPDKRIPGIKYTHLQQKGNGLKNRLEIIKGLYSLFKRKKFDFILLNYFLFCSIVKLLTKSPVAVEIRSSYIFNSVVKRFIYNSIMLLEVRLFSNITTISTGIKKLLHLPNRTYIIPLGGDKRPFIDKTLRSFKILYVGTFYNRNIENTIKAFELFYNKYKNNIDMEYNIIGIGSSIDKEKIRSVIDVSNVGGRVKYLGSIRYPELSDYFKHSNIGISYIPLTKHYDVQPPTKTFEYLLNGMVVLGTNTSEHKKIIDCSNGVLTGDSIKDVFSGLVYLYHNKNLFSSRDIQESAQRHAWQSIVNNQLDKYITTII